ALSHDAEELLSRSRFLPSIVTALARGHHRLLPAHEVDLTERVRLDSLAVTRSARALHAIGFSAIELMRVVIELAGDAPFSMPEHRTGRRAHAGFVLSKQMTARAVGHRVLRLLFRAVVAGRALRMTGAQHDRTSFCARGDLVARLAAVVRLRRNDR